MKQLLYSEFHSICHSAIIGGAREEDGAEITNMRNQAEAMNHEMQELIKERSRLEKENVELQ